MTDTSLATQQEARALTDRIKAGFAEVYSLRLQQGTEARTGRRRPAQQSVYFIQATNGMVKIGIASDPHGRLRALQTGSPLRLRLLATIPNCGPETEADLHSRFAEHRAHGEWFLPAAALLDFIRDQT